MAVDLQTKQKEKVNIVQRATTNEGNPKRDENKRQKREEKYDCSIVDETEGSGKNILNVEIRQI